MMPVINDEHFTCSVILLDAHLRDGEQRIGLTELRVHQVDLLVERRLRSRVVVPFLENADASGGVRDARITGKLLWLAGHGNIARLRQGDICLYGEYRVMFQLQGLQEGMHGGDHCQGFADHTLKAEGSERHRKAGGSQFRPGDVRVAKKWPSQPGGVRGWRWGRRLPLA